MTLLRNHIFLTLCLCTPALAESPLAPDCYSEVTGWRKTRLALAPLLGPSSIENRDYAYIVEPDDQGAVATVGDWSGIGVNLANGAGRQAEVTVQGIDHGFDGDIAGALAGSTASALAIDARDVEIPGLPLYESGC